MNKKAGIIVIGVASKISIVFTAFLFILLFLLFGFVFLWQILGLLSGIGLFASEAAFQFPLTADNSLGFFIILKLIICSVCFLILKALTRKLTSLQSEFDIPLESAISDAGKKYDSFRGEIKVMSDRVGGALSEAVVPSANIVLGTHGANVKCPADKVNKVKNIVVDADEFWKHFLEVNHEMSDIELRMHFDNCYTHFITTVLKSDNQNNELNLNPKVRAQFAKYMLS